MASHAGEDQSDGLHEMEFRKRGCFWIPCIGSNRGATAGSTWWQRIGTVESMTNNDPWWFRGWMKVRNWSELVAGPKWKTFIRRFGRNSHCLGAGVGGGVSKRSRFQYDPLSYALNFDEGQGQNGHFINEDLAARGFSSRMNLGKDAPPLT